MLKLHRSSSKRSTAPTADPRRPDRTVIAEASLHGND